MRMQKININEIKILSDYLNSNPSPIKFKFWCNYFEKNKKQGKPIVLNSNNELIDGYIQYLVLKNFGVEECWYTNNLDKKEKYRDTRTMYVYGRHLDDEFNRIYIWRVSNGYNWSSFKRNVKIGDCISCYSKGKIVPVIVQAIRVLNRCPVPFKVKLVATDKIHKVGEI